MRHLNRAALIMAMLAFALIASSQAEAAQKKPPLISFLTPSGGEVYIPGQEQVVIMPLNSAVANIELRLSTDGGVTFPTVIATASNVGLEREKTKTVKFTVPNTPATTCIIKAVGTSKKGNVEAVTASFVIGSPFLPPGAVNSIILADSAVETQNVKDAAITTAKLADGSVTNPKLAEGAVTNNKVSSEVGGAGGSNATNNFVLAADGAGKAVWKDLSTLGINIGNANIVADAVTGNKILDGTIFSADIAPLAGITDGQVNDNLTIAGGTVNNTPIGGTTPSTGAFTTLSVNSTGTGITFVPNNEVISNNTNDIIRLSSNTGSSFDVDMTGSGGAGLSLRGNPASGLFRIEGQSAVAAPGTTVEVRGGQGTAGGALVLRGGAGTATLGGDVTIDPGVSNAGTSGNLNITTPTVVLDSDNVSTNVNIDITARRFPASGSGVLRYDTAGNWLISNDNGSSFNALLTSASGTFWSRLGNGGTNPATNFIGTTDPTDLFFRVNNAQVMRYIPGSSPTIIGGFSGNSIGSAAVIGATIGGGGSSSVGSTNIVHDRFGTIGGGEGNIVGTPGDAITETHAVTAGGFKNSASAIYSAVGGGSTNVAGGVTGTGSAATVAGGEFNAASGAHSAIPGGKSNTASGTLSFAAGELNTASGTNSVAIGKNNSVAGNSSFALGERATVAAGNANSFIWNDSGTTAFTTTNTNQFWASAANGFWFRGVISAGGNSSTTTPPTQVTDANGKVLSTALNTVEVPQGGTGRTSFTTNAVIYGNGTNALLNSGASTAAGQFLQTDTAGAAPTWKTILGVANGGTGLASGTDGGILAYTATGTIASSGLLNNNRLIVGGGAGATPRTLSSVGTTTTVLHGNAAGEPSFGAVSLTADVAGILPVANGGTGDDSVAPNTVFAGPSSGAVDGAPSFRLLVGADLPLSGAPYVLKSGDTMTGLLTNSTNTTSLALTGTPASNSGASLVQIGSTIVSGNGAANGGTYIGLNAPAAGAGSAADFINFQQNGTDRFRVTGAGAATFASTGTFGGALTATSFTGTVATSNLSGFVAVNNGGTGTNTTTGAAQVFAGPTGGAGAPSFRALVAADLPSGGAAPYVLDTGDTMTGNLFINVQPTASATTSVLGLGNAISGGNAAVDGGTFLGLNAPSTGAGSAADFINFQKNSISQFKVSNAGVVTGATFKSADGVAAAPVSLIAGTPPAATDGNDVIITATGPISSASDGGDVSITSGNAFTGVGNGGNFTVTTGNAPGTGNAGDITFNSGTANAAPGVGGDIALNAGAATTTGTGGSITLNPGSSGTGTPGKVIITKNVDLTGTAPTLAATAGPVSITTANNDNITLSPGGTGSVNITKNVALGANNLTTTGTVSATTFNGAFTGNISGNLTNANVTVTASSGDATVTASAAAGDVNLTAGATSGDVNLTPGTSGAIIAGNTLNMNTRDITGAGAITASGVVSVGSLTSAGATVNVSKPIAMGGNAISGVGALTATSAALTNTTNQLVLGTTNTVTINSPAPAAARVHTIPVLTADADFVMTAGTQTIGGAKTLSSAVTITPGTNQIVLGAGNTTTLNSVAPSASRTYTIPDATTNTEFVMAAGNQTIAGSKTLSAALAITPATNQLVLGTTNTVTVNAAAPGAPRIHTIPALTADAEFVMTQGNQTIAGKKTFTGITALSSGAAVASAATIVPTGNLFHVTGTTLITSIDATGISPGTVITLIFDGAASVDETGNIKISGTSFTAAANTTMTFVFDGTSWFELSRSSN